MYIFPIIDHINDVLPAIEGRKEFIVAERDGYKIINYSVMLPDSFPIMKTTGGSAKMRAERIREKAIRRELRGIIFDDEGNLIRRPLHKFFNINENEEVLSKNLLFSEKHFIQDKLDGSMISPFIVKGELIWGTKMAAREFHDEVSAWVKNNPIYAEFSRNMIEKEKCTPIFEWTSPNNRIVVGYKEAGLTLLAIRSMPTGDYASIEAVESFREQGISVVKHYSGVTDVEKFIEETRDLVDAEGFVVSWENGYKVKIKSNWYVQIHKAKEKILFERHIFKMFYENTLDDVLAFLPQDDVDRINKYISEALEEINEYTEYVHGALDRIHTEFKYDKKSFALSNFSTSLDHLTKSLCFKFFDDRRDLGTHILKRIYEKTSSNSSYAEIKEVIFPKTKYFLSSLEE